MNKRRLSRGSTTGRTGSGLSAEQGYVHVYTGDGKGKTTAALGLTLRCAGHGMSVYWGQFLKGRETGEIRALRRLGRHVRLEQYGRKGFVAGAGRTAEDRALAEKGLARARHAIQAKRYRLVVLDEINTALSLKLLRTRDVIHLVESRPPHVEIVLTGRGAPRSVVRMADLVSRIVEVKHYFRQGVKARKGIEE